MDQDTFEPDYGNAMSRQVLVFLLFAASILYTSRADLLFWIIFLVLAGGFGVLLRLLMTVRYIQFGPLTFIIVRYWLPSRDFNYTDIVEVGAKRIKIREWGQIYMDDMKNGEELRQLFMDRLKQLDQPEASQPAESRLPS